MSGFDAKPRNSQPIVLAAQRGVWLTPTMRKRKAPPAGAAPLPPLSNELRSHD